MTTTVLNPKVEEVEDKTANTLTLVTKKIGEVESKLPANSSLKTATVLNIKIKEVENEISGHNKHITTPDVNTFSGSVFGTKKKSKFSRK